MIDSIIRSDKKRRIFSPNTKGDIILDDYKYRDWDYRKTNNYKYTKIEGKLKKKVNFSPKKEPKIYNNIKIYPQPNSIRTILPEYNPESNEKPSGKKLNININSYSQDKRRIDRGIKTNNKRNKESNEEIQLDKRLIKNAEFQQYKTTQITTLPGKVTRELNSIKDDKNDLNKMKEKKNKSIYFINKVKNDYCSKISCLPNSLTNNLEENRLIRGKSYSNFKNKNEFNIFENGPKSKIKREKKNEDKERPFSHNNYNNNGYTNIIRKYKNAESSQNFDNMKPSSILEKKYQIRITKS